MGGRADRDFSLLLPLNGLFLFHSAPTLLLFSFYFSLESPSPPILLLLRTLTPERLITGNRLDFF